MAVFSAPRGWPVRPVMSRAWTGSLGAVTGHGGCVQIRDGDVLLFEMMRARPVGTE